MAGACARPPNAGADAPKAAGAAPNAGCSDSGGQIGEGQDQGLPYGRGWIRGTICNAVMAGLAKFMSGTAVTCAGGC